MGVFRPKVVARAGSAVVGVGAPAAAAQQAELIHIIGMPIEDPLTQIAHHIVKSVAVGREGADRTGVGYIIYSVGRVITAGRAGLSDCVSRQKAPSSVPARAVRSEVLMRKMICAGLSPIFSGRWNALRSADFGE